MREAGVVALRGSVIRWLYIDAGISEEAFVVGAWPTCVEQGCVPLALPCGAWFFWHLQVAGRLYARRMRGVPRLGSADRSTSTSI